MSAPTTTADSMATSTLSSYAKFRIALKSNEVKRQYPNLLQKFLDFCKFEGIDIEQKAIKFSCFAKSRSQEEVEDLVTAGLSYSKRRE
jgi:hypothetical protein